MIPAHFLYFFIYWCELKIGGVILSAIGYLQVHAYTSRARIPVQYAAIAVTDVNGSAIALRLTNSSGVLDEAIAIEVPDLSASQSPNTGIIPFTVVDLYARAENFEQIHIKKLQLFADTITDQNLELIPLSEFPAQWSKEEIFETSAQNL